MAGKSPPVVGPQPQLQPPVAVSAPRSAGPTSADALDPDSSAAYASSGFGLGAVRDALSGWMGDAAPPPDPHARLAALQALPEDQRIEQLRTLLASGWLTGPSQADLWVAAEVVEGLSPEGRATFVAIDDGALAATLVAAGVPTLEEEPAGPSAFDQVAAWAQGDDAWDDVTTFAGGMGQLAWDSGNALMEGRVEADLDTMQQAVGGPAGGLALENDDERPETNRVQITGDADDGRIEIRVPELRIAGVQLAAEAGTVTTGRGVVHGILIAVDTERFEGDDATVEAGLDDIQWFDVDIAAEGLGVAVPRLIATALRLRQLKSPGKATAADLDALVATVTEQVKAVALALAQATGTFAQYTSQLSADPTAATLGPALLDDFAGRQDFGLSVEGLFVQDVAVTDADGTVHRVGDLGVHDVQLTVAQRDALDAYGEELTALKALDPRTGAQDERIAFLEAELPRLRALAAEKLGYDAILGAGGTLPPGVHDRYIALDRQLTVGVATVHVGAVSVDGVDVMGTEVDSAFVGQTDGRVSASQLGGLGASGVHNLGETSGEEAAGLDAWLAAYSASKNGPAPAVEEPAAETPLAMPMLDALMGELTVQNASADGVRGDGFAVDHASASDLRVQAAQDAAHLDLGAADVTGASGMGASVDGAHVRGIDVSAKGSDVGGAVGQASVDGAGYAAGGMDAGVDHAEASGLRFDANLDQQRLRSGGVDAASLRGASYTDGTTTASLGSASLTGASVTGATADGVDALDVAAASIGDAAYGDGTTHAAVGAASIGGLHAHDLDATALTGAGTLDSADLSGVSYDDGANTLSLGTASARGMSIDRSSAGTVATLEGANATDVAATSSSYDLDLALGSASVGRAGVALDGNDGLVGASADDLGLAGLAVSLVYDRTPTGDVAPDAVEAAPDRLHADALAGASGVVRLDIPITMYGITAGVHLTVVARDGKVPVGEIGIVTTGPRDRETAVGRLLGDLASAAIEVQPGRGLVVGSHGICLYTAMDTRDYGGLESGRKAGGKGAIALQPFLEAFWNGVTRAELTPEAIAELEGEDKRAYAREQRRDAKAERQQDRADRKKQRQVAKGTYVEPEPEPVYATNEEYAASYGIDTGKVRVDTTGLSTGNGRLGLDSASMILDDEGDAGTNRFTIHGTLNDLAVGANRVHASSLAATGPSGAPVSLTDMGIGGLDVRATHPLGMVVGVQVDVAGTMIRAVRFGDTSALGDGPG